MPSLLDDPAFGEFPLSAEAIYELMHFEHWGNNLLRTRILGMGPQPMPPHIELIDQYGRVRSFVTDPSQRLWVIAAIKATGIK
jgi:hypothetical protein